METRKIRGMRLRQAEEMARLIDVEERQLKMIADKYKYRQESSEG